ncbi:hypothetical protein COOONC_13547 [Cooperia oncophora]
MFAAMITGVKLPPFGHLTALNYGLLDVRRANIRGSGSTERVHVQGERAGVLWRNRGPLMDDNTRYKILYYHEGTRNVLALGESPGYATGFLPPAKNLFKLVSSKLTSKMLKNLVFSIDDKLMV